MEEIKKRGRGLKKVYGDLPETGLRENNHEVYAPV